MKGYNFNFAVSAKISAKVVEEMITRVVEEQTGKKVASVRIDTGTVTRGMGMSEHDETVFEGVTVFFEKENVVGKVPGGFVKDSYTG